MLVQVAIGKANGDASLIKTREGEQIEDRSGSHMPDPYPRKLTLVSLCYSYSIETASALASRNASRRPSQSAM